MDWNTLSDSIPFLAASPAGSVGPKVSFQRIGEFAITGLIAAFGAAQLTVAKLETKTDLSYAFSQKQFSEQVERRNKEMDQLRAQIAADALRQQVQYEALRIEIQRLAVNLEKRR